MWVEICPLQCDAEITTNEWEGSEMKLCVNMKYSHHLPWPQRHWVRLFSNSVTVSEAYIKLSRWRAFVFFYFWQCLETNCKTIFLGSILHGQMCPFPWQKETLSLIWWRHLKNVLLLVTFVLIIAFPEMLSKWWKNKIWYPLNKIKSFE